MFVIQHRSFLRKIFVKNHACPGFQVYWYLDYLTFAREYLDLLNQVEIREYLLHLYWFKLRHFGALARDIIHSISLGKDYKSTMLCFYNSLYCAFIFIIFHASTSQKRIIALRQIIQYKLTPFTRKLFQFPYRVTCKKDNHCSKRKRYLILLTSYAFIDITF